MTTDQTPARTSVEVVYKSERDVDGWALRHARGEVPGRWPYGLDRLAGPGVDVTARSVPAPGRGARLLARTLPGRPGRGVGHPGTRDIGVAWDENVAERMLVAAPHREMYSGAIWVTDAMATGGSGRGVDAALRTLRRMDGIFVNSRPQVEALAAALGRSGPPVSFFRFGVDPDFFAARAYPERPLVVSVGGDRDRDPATLFPAMERVLQARPGTEVVVQSASDLPPPPGVTKVPRVSHAELRELYARATVVAVATRPNLHLSGLTVSLEAMATARPVVRTRTPGVDDYFEDGTTAHLVPPGDPATLADRVLDLLDAPDAAREMGRTGRRAVLDRMTSDGMAGELGRVLGLGTR
jgi:Glycosyl transferases group 1